MKEIKPGIWISVDDVQTLGELTYNRFREYLKTKGFAVPATYGTFGALSLPDRLEQYHLVQLSADGKLAWDCSRQANKEENRLTVKDIHMLLDGTLNTNKEIDLENSYWFIRVANIDQFNAAIKWLYERGQISDPQSIKHSSLVQFLTNFGRSGSTAVRIASNMIDLCGREIVLDYDCTATFNKVIYPQEELTEVDGKWYLNEDITAAIKQLVPVK